MKYTKIQISDLRFERGVKGKPKLLLGGFAYFRNNSNCGRTYWLCSRNRYLKCKARLITRLDCSDVVIKNQNHNHPPEYETNLDDSQNNSNSSVDLEMMLSQF